MNETERQSVIAMLAAQCRCNCNPYCGCACHKPAPTPFSVKPVDIEMQRQKGWPDFHPEAFCHRCGTRNLHAWHVDSDRFNAACAALRLDKSVVLCVACFEEGWCEATGMVAVWELLLDLATWPESDGSSGDADG